MNDFDRLTAYLMGALLAAVFFIALLTFGALVLGAL